CCRRQRFSVVRPTSKKSAASTSVAPSPKTLRAISTYSGLNFVGRPPGCRSPISLFLELRHAHGAALPQTDAAQITLDRLAGRDHFTALRHGPSADVCADEGVILGRHAHRAVLPMRNAAQIRDGVTLRP